MRIKQHHIRLTLLVAVLLTSMTMWGQLQVVSSNAYLQVTTNVIDVDAVIFINGIDASTQLQFQGAGTLRWEDHNGTLLSTTTNVTVNNATGYRLKVNGQQQAFVWVIDYSLYALQGGDLIEQESADPCQRIELRNETIARQIMYGDSLGAMHTLIREFTLSYDDYVFTGDSAASWQYQRVDSTLIGLPSVIYLPSPYNNTRYVVRGDQFALQMGLTTDSLVIDYYAKAITAHLTATVIERDGLNEVDRSSNTDVSGSAPLVVQFNANSNIPIAAYHKWTIYNFDNLDVLARYSDTEFRYTFNETGSYIAKLEVAGEGTDCEYVDSVRIIVRDSYIEVPNVFTPNGDGVNDEFRIAYRSIKQYSIKVVNRWGVVVYSSNDPTKGWDGNINGKPAAEGTYFYFIEAYGTDRDSKNRYMKYKKCGDINLLR